MKDKEILIRIFFVICSFLRKTIYAMRICLLLITCTVLSYACNPIESSLTPISFQGLKGRVADAGTGDVLSARIVIEDENGNIPNSYYSHIPGFFTEEDGSFQQALDPGKYSVSIYHGIDYESQTFQIEVGSGQGFEANTFLKTWFPLKEKGWFTGGGHCHLYTEKDMDFEMLAKVRRICLAQGIDFVCASQGWAGFNDSTWREGYARFSDDRFLMHYGSEMPKYRSGHTYWFGQTSTRDYYHSSMDTSYENKYYQAETGTHWSYDNLEFPNIPNIEVVQGLKRAENAVAIMPHPTSWWWQKRGDVTKYTTNVASYLSFGLLAGKIWDGFVVMGYNHDHYAYQNIWFHILNQGYRMPAISELDGGLGKNDRFYYGSMRTYFQTHGDYSISSVADAIRRGETFVTSGPIIMANIDDQYNFGEVIRIDDQKHTLHIEALASGDMDEYLSYIIVYRNGEIFKHWDVRAEKPRKFEHSLEIIENEQAWYVVKAYGKKAWEDPAHLDILGVCNKKSNKEIPPYNGDRHDVCITSPFYFWPEGSADPEPLVSEVSLSLISSTGENIDNASIDIIVNGTTVNTVSIQEGTVHFNMPVHGILRIVTPDNKTIHRGLFLDYKPHLNLVEKLASGQWLEDESEKYSEGEVPWSAFNYEKTKELLSRVDWEIVFTPNERDHLWADFEDHFDN